MANLNFNANDVEPQSSFDPLPPGWYPVQIVDSDMMENSKKNGHYLKLEMDVVEGDYMNRKIFTQLNLDNPNEVAVRIAHEQLSSICHAVGVLEISDSQQLHGLPFEVKVKVTPSTEQYEARNEVKGFRALEGSMGNAPSQGTGANPSWATGNNAKDSQAADAQTTAASHSKPAPKKPAPRLEMIDTEYSYEAWRETGRTDQDLVEEGIARWVEVQAAPPSKPAPKPSPKATAGTNSPQSSPAQSADGAEVPPWMRK